MIRSMDYGNGRMARALLSDRYRRIDNMEIASAVLPLFAGQADMQVMSCEVTEDRMYLKIVNRRLEMDVVPGDTVQGGVICLCGCGFPAVDGRILRGTRSNLGRSQLHHFLLYHWMEPCNRRIQLQ